MLTKHPERIGLLNDGSDDDEGRAVMVFISMPEPEETEWMGYPLSDPAKHRIEIVVWSDGSVLLNPIDEDGFTTEDGVGYLYPSQADDLWAVLNSGYMKGTKI